MSKANANHHPDCRCSWCYKSEETRQAISDTIRLHHSQHPEKWENSEEWREKHSRLTKGKSYPNRGRSKGYEWSDSERKALVDAWERGEQPGSAKLTRTDVWNIRFVLLPSGLSYKQIANTYNVSPKSIKYIHIGKTWTWVTEND